MSENMPVASPEEVTVPEEFRESQAARFREIVAIFFKNDLIKGPTPQRLFQTIQDLGPTYVKIGQIMSMRPDMIPQEYCTELAKLRTDVEPMPYEDARKVLVANYGTNLKEIFQEVDPTPLGSASIAQAHAATLVGGEQVVLKIQRPGIFEMMSDDVAMLRKAARASRMITRANGVDLVEILDEMWSVAQEELDFLVEAKHCEAFAEYNADEERIACPKIYGNLTTSKVLVEERIIGISVGDTEALDAAGYDRNDLGTVLANNYLKQVIVDGFFHADPHPGNIWVRDNEIVWIDMGMMGHLSPKDRKLISQAVWGYVNHDVSAVKEVVLSLGQYSGEINHPRLYGDIDTFLTKYGSMDMESVNMGKVMNELMDIARTNGISMPADFTMFTRGLATIEGTMETLSPAVNLVEIFSKQLEAHYLNDTDFAKELGEKARKLYNSTSKAIEMPGLATDLLKMTLRGRTRINMQMSMTDEFDEMTKDLVNRIVVGLVISAFLIGSSFLCTTDMNPKILNIPALGVVGFIIAVALGVWVIIDSMRSRRH